MKCEVCSEREEFRKLKGLRMCVVCYKNNWSGLYPKTKKVKVKNQIETKLYKLD